MQLRSLQTSLAAIEEEISRVNVDTLSGSDAAVLLKHMSLFKNRLDLFVGALGVRAVQTNIAHVDSAKSGAAWLAERTGVSERSAREMLGVQSQLSDLPDVRQAVELGSLSMGKAAVIGHAAEGNLDIARELLHGADISTVEAIQHKARQLRAENDSCSRSNA